MLSNDKVTGREISIRQIALITGSRGEYGYIRPIIREIESDPGLDYALIVTNLHLLSDFGLALMKSSGTA